MPVNYIPVYIIVGLSVFSFWVFTLVLGGNNAMASEAAIAVFVVALTLKMMYFVIVFIVDWIALNQPRMVIPKISRYTLNAFSQLGEHVVYVNDARINWLMARVLVLNLVIISFVVAAIYQLKTIGFGLFLPESIPQWISAALLIWVFHCYEQSKPAELKVG